MKWAAEIDKMLMLGTTSEMGKCKKTFIYRRGNKTGKAEGGNRRILKALTYRRVSTGLCVCLIVGQRMCMNTLIP